MMKLKNYAVFLFLLIFSATAAWAQVATIIGKVTESDGIEPLMGATVRLMKDSTMIGGAYTDDNGDYTIRTEPGTYTLVFTYISYATETVDGISVAAGQTETRDLSLGLDIEDTGDKNTVVIIGKVVKNNEAAVINIRRKSASVVDVISFDQVKRAGDSDAGGAMKRVTGVTVEGGKYVYVRGLGDRYSKTLLNGSEIPGLDPDRNSVQMDMFPSNLIDNLVVHKSFTPDLPGSFSGGLVKIATKDFPSSFTMQYTSSFGVNTQSSFLKDFISGKRGRLEFLGLDDGTRALPELLADGSTQIPSISFTDAAAANQLDQASNAFSTDIYPETTNSALNHSHSFSIGDQKKLLGKPFGYLASISYNNTKSFYENAVEGRWQRTGNSGSDLNMLRLYEGQTATRDVLWGSLVNFSWLPSLNHQFRVNYMHNQSGTSQARFLQGANPSDASDLEIQTRVSSYKQRAMDAIQLRGDHSFGKFTADWVSALIFSSQDEPDLRFFTNSYYPTTNSYAIETNLYTAPSRYFRSMKEVNLDGKLNMHYNFKQWSDLDAKLSFGGGFTNKNRTFTEHRYEFVNNSSSTITYNGDEAAYWDQANLGVIGQDNNGTFLYGNYLRDGSEARNSYSGSQSISAAYAMVELPLVEKLRLITGARMETTNISVISRERSLPEGSLNNTDILPSVNLVFSPNADAFTNIMNVRGSYSRTLARPVFRELAPFASFDFVGDVIIIGNPDLQRSLTDNFDLRWELFPTTRELLSVGAFYKRFTDPIERIIIPGTNASQATWRNVDAAKLFGIEIEMRKSLEFISPKLKNLRVSGNVTFIKSEVVIDPQVYQAILGEDSTRSNVRQMYGQSPYTINGEIAYINDSIGFNTSLNFNVFGPRISFVTDTGTPNVFEQPRPSLDFSIAKTLGKNFSLRFRARNLLDPLYNNVHTFQDVDYTFRSYRVGRTFSLSLTYNI